MTSSSVLLLCLDALLSLSQILVRLDGLSLQDPAFLGKVTASKFVPNAADPSVLCRPNQLFDPSVPSLISLLDASSFPAQGDLRRAECLASMRKLGMRAALSRVAVRCVHALLCVVAIACCGKP